MFNKKEQQKILQELNNPEFSHVISDRSGKKISRLKLGKDIFLVKVFNFEYIMNPSEGPLIPIKELYSHESGVLKELFSFNGQYVDHFELENKGYLISKFIEGVSVREYIKANPEKTETIFFKCKEVIDDLHGFGFLHGDIQPAHFLVDSEEKISLVDYGLSGLLPFGYEKYPGQLVYYASPEVCKFMLNNSADFKYSLESELYSFASTMVFAISGELSTYFQGGYKNFSFEEKKSLIAKNGADNYFDHLMSNIPVSINNILTKYLSYSKEERI